MYDYASVFMLGRATHDATIFSNSDGRPTKAIVTIALNIPYKKGGEIRTRTIYREVMVLGSYATYVEDCQSNDSLVGRLINVVGSMDDNRSDSAQVIRVAPGEGVIKIMDRRTKHDD